jgi:glycosyltransferase involved in cell wall biosynthesis
MDRPLVTVIVPTFDRRELVCEAIESVLAQTHARFELIVVDDRSTDGTADVVARYGDADPRVACVRQAHAGPGAARNHGLARARGDWTVFLDSDDLLLPGCLAGQLAAADAARGADLVVCDARHEGGEHAGTTVFARPAWIPPLSMDAMVRGAWAPLCCLCVRTAVARALRFDPTSLVEDSEFLFHLHAEGHVAVVNPTVLALHRRHRGERGAPHRFTGRGADGLALIDLLAAYADRAPHPRRTWRAYHARRARWLVERNRWREARPHLWGWWRRKPNSVRAARYLVRSLLARTSSAERGRESPASPGAGRGGPRTGRPRPGSGAVGDRPSRARRARRR